MQTGPINVIFQNHVQAFWYDTSSYYLGLSHHRCYIWPIFANRPAVYAIAWAMFCQGFKNEGTFDPSPLKMRGHFQTLGTSKFIYP